MFVLVDTPLTGAFALRLERRFDGRFFRGETAVEEPFAQHHLHLRKSAGFVGEKGLRELIGPPIFCGKQLDF